MKSSSTSRRRWKPSAALPVGLPTTSTILLTAIQGYTALLQSALPEGSEEREMTEEVFSAVQRASRLTTQLLTFSRQEIPNPLPLDLNSIVDNMEKMLRRLIGETMSSWHLRSVRQSDRSKEIEVASNRSLRISSSTRQTPCPMGGRLTIRTENVHIDQEKARRPAAPHEGSYALLSVEDEGLGMDSDTLAQIFEPFFTTKPRGSGTGLGLATVYGIVKQSEGHISVDSEPGKGTTFRIYLPVRAVRRELQPIDHPIDTARSGKETVMIVEDEPAVRRLTRRFLEAGGYKVVEATDVGDAIRMANGRSETIDILLTDVIMPELSGPELAKRTAGPRSHAESPLHVGLPGRIYRPPRCLQYRNGLPPETLQPGIPERQDAGSSRRLNPGRSALLQERSVSAQNQFNPKSVRSQTPPTAGSFLQGQRSNGSPVSLVERSAD